MNDQSTKYKQYPLQYQTQSSVDIVLIGAGIMSVTLGMFLVILEPSWIIHIYERLNKPAQESSNAWNNAGTGHAAFCELNYTEYNTINNSININKALYVNNLFELSLQFWAYLTQKNILNNTKSFINNIPHMSFVWGEKNITFLRKRFQKLKNHIGFNGMLYSEDVEKINSWIPLMIQGRNKNQKIAATYMETGTDINFEEITKQLLIQLNKNANFKIYLQHDVLHIQRNNSKNWNITIKNIQNKKIQHVCTRYVFVGAGGQTLNLLQTTKIPEIKGYAGFPVGGQFLTTNNPNIITQHSAKVYGKASLHMPPMSTPHLDTRILNTHKLLLFGPFATFSGKFLKYGSSLDLFYSLNKNNIISMIQAGIDNYNLIKYLINQLLMSHQDRINLLKQYYPHANSKDWSLIQAGQRVQIIKKNYKNKGILQFGTEIISSHDGTISGLLGASPGASIATSIAIRLLHFMFTNKTCSTTWKTKLSEIIPSYTFQFENQNMLLNKKIQNQTRNILQLKCIK